MVPARSYVPHRRHSVRSTRPFVAFLLLASFGILFAGCGGKPQADPDVFTFTEDDVARFRELADSAGVAASSTGTELGVPRLEPNLAASSGGQVVLDAGMVSTYDAVRSDVGGGGENIFRVNNAYLNVRSEPRITSTEIARLTQGDTLTVLDFVNAAWAKVRLADGTEGYVSTRYIAKLVAEEDLAAERAKYEGTYFVDFGFLNVRASPDAQSEKIGELPGQAFVRPLSMDKVWARIPFDGREGYVAVQYLSPFLPNFLVRQNTYALPILHYRLAQEGDILATLARHVEALRSRGVNLWTFAQFRDLVLRQEERDVRVPPNTVLLAVSNVTPENVQEVADTLRTIGVSATLFLQTRFIGMEGITERTLLNLQANGNDLQSAGHTGDDLRSLTNAQMDLELRQSRQLIEQYTRRPVFAIAYPLGGVNDRVMQQAAKAGYLFGVGSAPEKTFTRAQFLRLPSILVTSGMDAADVVDMVLHP